MYGLVVAGAMLAVVFNSSVFGRIGGDARRLSEVNPVWSTAPPSPITHRNKGDVGDIDPRGSVRYNVGVNGKVIKGTGMYITKHREVPIDDDGTGIEQAKEECCFPDSYE